MSNIKTDDGIRRIVNRKYSDVENDYDQSMGAIMDRFYQSLRIHR